VTITDDLIYDAAISGGSYQIHRALPGSTAAVQITTDITRDNWWPVRNPADGRLYYCSTPVGTHDTSPTAFQTMTIRSCRMDGTGDQQVLGLPATVDATWTQYGHPEFNAAGTRMCVFVVASGVYALVEFNTTTWTTVSLPRLMTGADACVDPSYSPDGTKIVFAEAVSGVPRISTVVAGSTLGTVTNLVSGGAGILSWWDPYYSPDGTKIVALCKTGADVPVSAPVGTWGLKHFTSAGASVTTIVDDGDVNGRATWIDNDSVVFHRFENPPVTTFQLYTIDIDGTDLAAVQYVASNVNGEYPRLVGTTDSADPSPDLVDIGRSSKLTLEGSSS
jgi:hypothetical protein